VPSNAWTLVQGAAVRRAVARGVTAAPLPPPAGADLSPDALIVKAAEARAAGKLGAAASALAAARAAAPGDARAAFAAGSVAASAQDWPRAAEAFRAAAASETDVPQRGRALFGLGVALSMQLPRTPGAMLTPEIEAAAQEARQAFRDAAAARPGDAAPRMALAAALKLAGRLPEARDAAAEAVALDPRAAPALAELDALIAKHLAEPKPPAP
jgi:tetratricopeptide (TPR) repeat protein